MLLPHCGLSRVFPPPFSFLCGLNIGILEESDFLMCQAITYSLDLSCPIKTLDVTSFFAAFLSIGDALWLPWDAQRKEGWEIAFTLLVGVEISKERL